MSVTAASIKLRFPEFASEDDARITLFIGDAELILNPSAWGDKLDLGTAYLVAHYIALANKSSDSGSSTPNAGPVTGRAVDGASVSYASATLNDQSEAYYMQTLYGQRYWNLLKTLGIPAFIV